MYSFQSSNHIKTRATSNYNRNNSYWHWCHRRNDGSNRNFHLRNRAIIRVHPQVLPYDYSETTEDLVEGALCYFCFNLSLQFVHKVRCTNDNLRLFIEWKNSWKSPHCFHRDSYIDNNVYVLLIYHYSLTNLRRKLAPNHRRNQVMQIRWPFG